MHITLIATGTRGDVQPLLALAKGLHRAGYGVRMATHAEFETLVHEQDVEYFELHGSPSQLMHDPALLESMGGSSRSPFTLIRGIFQAIKPLFVQGVTDVLNACQDTDALIVSLLGLYGACHVAEKLNLPLYEGYVLPGRPTRAFASPLVGADLHLGGTVNRLSQALPVQFAWWMFQPPVNHARRVVLDLPPISFRRRFHEFDRRRQPVLYGYSPSVLPKPPDWRDWHHVTGYWFLDTPPGWQPPPALADFLDDGPPPVYVGFGSLVDRAPQRTAEIVIEALQRAGQRGILSTGWGGISPSDLPDTIFKLDSVPHDWLFPRTAAVVHHGGSGTTSAGLRAGVPSILVPLAADQYLWGRCIRRLGVGPDPIPRRKLTAERLADAIRTATGSASLRDCAGAFGERIRAEDGIGQAVRIIEAALSRRH